MSGDDRTHFLPNSLPTRLILKTPDGEEVHFPESPEGRSLEEMYTALYTAHVQRMAELN
jgi:hypothetical protein